MNALVRQSPGSKFCGWRCVWRVVPKWVRVGASPRPASWSLPGCWSVVPATRWLMPPQRRTPSALTKEAAAIPNPGKQTDRIRRASAGGERSADAEPGELKPDGRKPYHRKPGEWKLGGGRPVDQQPRKPEEEKPVGGDPSDGEGGVGEGPVTPPGGPVREEPPVKEEPKEPEEPEDCGPWWPPGPEPEPPPGGGGGGDGGQSGRPSGRPQMPTMQLSPLLRPENTPRNRTSSTPKPGWASRRRIAAVAPIALRSSWRRPWHRPWLCPAALPRAGYRRSRCPVRLAALRPNPPRGAKLHPPRLPATPAPHPRRTAPAIRIT